MWVKLKVTKVIQKKSYSPGQWVEVGTDEALRWIAAEHAETLDLGGLLSESDIGVVYPPSSKKPVLPFRNLALAEGGIKPLFPRSLIMNAPYSISDRDSPEFLRNIGKLASIFRLLQSWDVVLILSSFERNALSVAKDERADTEAIAHDLRVPYYQACGIGVKDSPKGREFCEVYTEERARGKVLASLRAYYRVQPLTYFAPPSWGRKDS